MKSNNNIFSKIVLIFSIALFFTTSCDKCEDKTCETGGNCDKKTGICEDLCENGGINREETGSCSCPTFYTGLKCETDIRDNYTNTYQGELTISYGNGTNNKIYDHSYTLSINNNPNELWDIDNRLSVTLLNNHEILVRGQIGDPIDNRFKDFSSKTGYITDVTLSFNTYAGPSFNRTNISFKGNKIK